ncbi:diguanylate cyclase domain-containing protein [Plantactinospora sp. CA-290183]|uniref:diguanylate cyclase domain-containing protein n=1 Tax=Plantactinospora sp. CA-290183 TaxID=3240006 RepID=UPI003D8F14A8
MSQTATWLVTAAGGVVAGLVPPTLLALSLRNRLVATRHRLLALEDEAETEILELEAQRDEYRTQATHDQMTGLPNRRAATAYLTDALNAPEQIGVVVLDLARFKEVNDRLGHRTGNTLLAQVGERLRRISGHFVYAARLSGDEFTLIVHGNEADTAAIAATARREISDTAFQIGNEKVTVTASVGYTVTDETDRGAEDLLHRADVAMYWAKANHCEVYGYAPHMGDRPRAGRPRDWPRRR